MLYVLPPFKGPKVIGQLAAQLFHGQVCVIPSLFHLQGADKRSRVHFKCGICVWNLLLSTFNMKSKELSLSVDSVSLRMLEIPPPSQVVTPKSKETISCTRR